jgi:hypothetical protein
MRIDARSAPTSPRPIAAPRPTRATRTEHTSRVRGAPPAGARSSASATRIVKAENRAAALDPETARGHTDQIATLMAARPPLDMRM